MISHLIVSLRSGLAAFGDGPVYALAALIFLTTFAHEFIAIGIAAAAIVAHRLSGASAAAIVFSGIIAGDWAIYGCGAVARKSARLRAWMDRRHVPDTGLWPDRSLIPVVVGARLLPAGLFPAFAGLGLTGVPFSRFACLSAVTAAVYVPAVLFLTVRAGTLAAATMGSWAWLALVPVGGLTLLAPRPRERATTHAGRSHNGVTHDGMPMLPDFRRAANLAERLPPVVFYAPTVLQWLWLGWRNGGLGLPSLANPSIENGGLFGESKAACLDLVRGSSRRWLAPYVAVAGGAPATEMSRAVTALGGWGADFPLVVKPDIGWRGFGVRLARDARSLAADIAATPPDQTVLVQKYIKDEGEAGIFYVRHPDQPRGRIFSMTFRYYPFVIGDGRSTVAQLIGAQARARWKRAAHTGGGTAHRGLPADELARVPPAGETVRLSFIGSNRVGGLYRDAREHVTAELEARIDAISHDIPEFYFGRYDVRFASLADLQRGENFTVVEVNGAGSEAIISGIRTRP